MKDKKSIFEKMKFIEKIPESSKEDANMSFSGEDNLHSQTMSINEEDYKYEIGQTNIEVAADTCKEDIEEYNSYTSDKAIEVSELYKNAGVADDNIRSIYIIDSFLKALPETLPNEAKRQSVLNIISASGMDLETLLEDGKKRINLIHTFHNSFISKTEDIIKQYQATIEELSNKIEKYKEAISQREDLQKDQDLKLEYESQRIENIIKFISKQ